MVNGRTHVWHGKQKYKIQIVFILYIISKYILLLYFPFIFGIKYIYILYWSFSFSIIPSKEIPGLIFRMDGLDLLAVQGTLKSLLQHHSSKASILRRSAFFIVQLSHAYKTTGKTIALTRQTIVVTCPKHPGPKYEPRYLFFTLTYNLIYSVSVSVLVP